MDVAHYAVGPLGRAAHRVRVLHHARRTPPVGESPDDCPANVQGMFEPFAMSEVPWEAHAHGARIGMRYQHLSSFGAGTQIGIATEVLAPGKRANPQHYHVLEKEHVLVLEGCLTVRASGTVILPCHALLNRGAKPRRYLVIGNPQAHDVVVFPESGRVSVKLSGQG